MAANARVAALWSWVRPLKDLRLWVFGAACTSFFWGVTAVSSQVSPSAFDLAVRGVGLRSFSTAFSVGSPVLDQALLVFGFAYVVFVLEYGLENVGPLVRVALLAPAAMLTFYFLLPPLLLPLGALGIVVSIAYIVLESGQMLGAPPSRALAPILLLLSATSCLLASVSAGRWLFNGIDGVTPFSDWTWGAPASLLSLLNQGYWLLPRLMLLLFLSWAVRAVLALYWDEARGFWTGLSRLFGRQPGEHEESLFPPGASSALFLVAIGGAAVAGIYPYLPAVNPSSILASTAAGTDYYAPAQLMLNQGPARAIGYVWAHGSAAVLMLTYILAAVMGSADAAVRFVPALLALLFTVATYSFVRFALKDRRLAATSAVFAAFSITVVVGTNAGLEDVWLGAAVALAFFTVLLAAFERSDRRLAAGAIALSLLLLGTDGGTWLTMLGVVLVFAIFSAGRRLFTGDAGNVRFVLLASAVLLAVDAAAFGLLLRLGSGSAAELYGNAAFQFSLQGLLGSVGTLQSAVGLYLGGALDNPLVVCLAIVGILSMGDLESDSHGLLFVWLLLVSLAAVFTGFSGPLPVWTALMLVPLPVFAAMGFTSMVRYASGLLAEGSDSGRRSAAGGMRWTYIAATGDLLPKAFVALSYLAVTAALASYALMNLGIV
jgi:hypothetical protein